MRQQFLKQRIVVLCFMCLGKLKYLSIVNACLVFFSPKHISINYVASALIRDSASCFGNFNYINIKHIHSFVNFVACFKQTYNYLYYACTYNDEKVLQTEIVLFISIQILTKVKISYHIEFLQFTLKIATSHW